LVIAGLLHILVLMTLRDRVHVPPVWMTSWPAAVRRV